MMKRLIGLALLSILLVGCSQTRKVSVLAERWEVGQHQDCIYKSDNLYCIAAEKSLGNAKYVTGPDAGKPVPRSSMLLSQAVGMIHAANGLSASEREKAELGTFDARFSEGATEYSVWDCLRTGLGSPGISCSLTKKPKTLEFVARQEEEAKLDDKLRSLTMEQLQAKCGQPQDTKSDNISRSLIYTSRSGAITFRYETFMHESSPVLDTAESEEQKDPKAARRIFWWRSAPSMSMHEAGLLAQDMPCLKN